MRKTTTSMAMAKSDRILYRSMQTRRQNLQQGSQMQFSSRIFPLNLVLLVAIMCFNCNLYTSNASSIQNNLLLGLGRGDGAGSSAVNQIATDAGGQQSNLMQQIMNDDFNQDFQLTIKTLENLSAQLEQFVKSEQMAEQIGKQANLMSLWAQSKGASETSRAATTEFDYILATFWSKFKPLIEIIVAQRPQNLGPNDLDFRCKRADELKELKEMSLHSSIYSMYLDTFFSELHMHCLLRKLALIKINRVGPSALLKQFVDIYLDLPTSKELMRAASKEMQEQVAHQLLAGHAFSFNLNNALAKHGPLSQAAQLVFDPRTALSMGPDLSNNDKLVDDFQSDCHTHNAGLGAIWADFDAVSSYLSSQTSNLLDLNEKVKLLAPQLVYGTICGQLTRLPR